MNRNSVIWIALGGFGLWYYFNNQTQVETAAQGAASDLEAATVGWKNAGSGPTWIPILNEAENAYGLAPDVLAATAYPPASNTTAGRNWSVRST